MAQYRGRHAAAGQAGSFGRRGVRSGSRLRRGLTGAAVAAAAMAALTASQAPGAGFGVPAGERDGDSSGPAANDGPPGDGTYHTELPPLDSPEPGRDSTGRPDPGGAESGVPATVLTAYKQAAQALREKSPGCGLRWELLAAIGKVESGQAGGGAVDKEGATLRPILGPVLNGSGFARIADTDGGRWDGDTEYDRAVGPMQFIPSTWSRWGADGNADGRRDPGNVHDAALTAGMYLCAGDRDLTAGADLDRAVLAYNDSRAYLCTVLSWYEYYREDGHEVPDGRGVLPTSPGAGAGDGPARGAEGSGGRGKGGASSRPGAGTPGSGADGAPAPNPGPGSGNGSGAGAGESGGTDGGGSGGGSGGGGSDSGGSDGDGGGGDGSSPDPSPSPGASVPTALEHAGEPRMTAPAGETFAEPARVRAENKAGDPVEGARVRFTVVGDTGARFPHGADRATVTTGAEGIASAPELGAGDTAGVFTVRAEIAGRDVPAAEFSFTVEDAPAPDDSPDSLTRTSRTPMTATTDEGTFAEPLRILATREGEPVEDAAVSARMVTGSGGEQPEESAKGPFFVGDEGEQVRSLRDLKTDGEGVLTLPEIRTGTDEGTYTLLLETADGTELRVGLTVAAP